jgi:hypothetical protein
MIDRRQLLYAALFCLALAAVAAAFLLGYVP